MRMFAYLGHALAVTSELPQRYSRVRDPEKRGSLFGAASLPTNRCGDRFGQGCKCSCDGLRPVQAKGYEAVTGYCWHAPGVGGHDETCLEEVQRAAAGCEYAGSLFILQ